MDPASAKELMAALAVFSGLVDKLGAEGILGLLIGSPLLMVIAFSAQGWMSTRRQQIMLDTYRDDALARGEENRKALYDLWEKHRQGIEDVLRQLGANQHQTTRYYEDNVELVKNYHRLADGLQTLIATTVRSIEQLTASVEILCKAKGL